MRQPVFAHILVTQTGHVVAAQQSLKNITDRTPTLKPRKPKRAYLSVWVITPKVSKKVPKMRKKIFAIK